MLQKNRTLPLDVDALVAPRGSRHHRTSWDVPLEKELLSLLGTNRDARIVAAYYGFDGSGGKTLRSVGRQCGLSHERIRQITGCVVSERSCPSRPHAPVLDRVIELIGESVPALASEIEDSLRFRGLTAGSFRLEGVLRAAELFGRTAPFTITRVRGSRLAHRSDGLLRRDEKSFDPVLRVAWHETSRWGVAKMTQVVAHVRKKECKLYDKALVESIVTCARGFRWLDQAAGWFWLTDVPQNPLLNRARKILSVVSPVRTTELWAGIFRDHRMRRISVPHHVLVDLCRQSPGIEVFDEKVSAKSAIDPEDVLDEAEIQMWHALSTNSGAMPRSKFKSVCFQMGIKPSTFYHHLLYSPIITLYEARRCGLTGSAMV